MEITNEPNSENRGNRKTSSAEMAREDEKRNRLKPTQVNEPKHRKKSGFKQAIKKVGYSVWLVVMIIGAALAFVAALFLI